MTLVLASASTSRAALLTAAGVPFTVQPAHVDEDAVKTAVTDGHHVAAALAEMKALAVPGDLVLGADQVLLLEGAVLSKAPSLDAAREQLRSLRGKRHILVSALALARDRRIVWRHVDEAQLWMRDFSDDFLEGYLAAEDVLGSVGCYRLEGAGVQLFERIEGDYFSILGLPLVPLLMALREQGVVAT